MPKTLVFAKDDSHAEDIVHIVREVFGKGNDFCKKITYKTTGEKTEDLIASFRNSPNPRIAVTVDMISTGTDIKPLECLLFMRDVRSSVYFEQMKGRGTRTISPTDFQAVTGDGETKTRFVIVDAVGVCETDKTDSRPLERKHTASFETLLKNVALDIRDEDTLSSLAGRLARLDRQIEEADRKEISSVIASEAKQSPIDAEIASSQTPLLAMTKNALSIIVNRLLDAVDLDKQIEKARAMFGVGAGLVPALEFVPTEEQIRAAAKQLTIEACAVFDNPRFRETLIEIHRRNEQTIDIVSKDQVVSAGFDAAAKERAQHTVESFKQFIEQNKDELTALQILYNLPYARRQLTYEAIAELARAIQKPPYRLTADELWHAYEQLDKAKVRGAGTQKLLANLVALVRFAIGANEVLEPFSVTVDRRFDEWLGKQPRAFTPEQREWLTMIKNHIATSLTIGWEDFDNVPFSDE
ncbi:MAG: hypothetical protein L0Y55_05825, partial [Anaerolineales bacterium]|nr:hypothetical protein [Anaerolineales bacterium]